VILYSYIKFTFHQGPTSYYVDVHVPGQSEASKSLSGLIGFLAGPSVGFNKELISISLILNSTFELQPLHSPCYHSSKLHGSS